MRYKGEDSSLGKVRPNRFSVDLEQAKARDIAWFKERQSEFYSVPCPACGSDEEIDRVIKDGAIFHRCAVCGMLYLAPRPSKEHYKCFLRESSVSQVFDAHIFPATSESRRECIYKPRLKFILNLLRKHAPDFVSADEHYVEVGAGAGAFAELVRDESVFASETVIEPGPRKADVCRSKGLRTISCMTEDTIPFERQAGLVAAFECLEHTSDPEAFIRSTSCFVRQDGILCISCPNGRGLDVVELREYSTTLGWTHPNLFTPESIRIFLERMGWTVLVVCTPGILDVDLLREAAEKKRCTFAPYSFWDQVIRVQSPQLDTAFQAFVAEHLLSSHMLVLARKN